MNTLWSPYKERSRIWLAGTYTDTAVHYLEVHGNMRLFLCRQFVGSGRCAACERAREGNRGFRAYDRWAWPMIDLEEGAVDIQILLASSHVHYELQKLLTYTNSVAIYRKGYNLDRTYTLYEYRVPAIAQRAYRKLCSGELPQLDYGTDEEMNEACPPSVLTELQPLDAMDMNWRGDPHTLFRPNREYCWNCGADTTDDFPMGRCRGCELKEEAEARCT